MANKHGEFIWYELCTDDADGARAFYGDLLGWRTADSGQPGMGYRLLSAEDPETGEENHVGGLMQLTDDMRDCGARPAWLGYIGVDDVDRSVARISAAGGEVCMAATDIPGVGRFAMVTDPQGIPFYVMRGASEETSLAFAFDRPRIGHCAWNELITPDPEAARAFYFGEFGWRKEGEMDMGPMGAYEFIRHNGVIGAIMPKPAEMPAPLWHYYFRVADIDTAIQKIRAGGGTVRHGPDEIPGGEYILKGLDPQGVLFALIGARKA